MTQRNRGLRNPDRLPPHDIGAEQAVLGCCLLKAEKVALCQKRFGGKQVFFDLRHQAIFDAMTALEAMDIVALRALLKDRGQLESCGGDTYLAALPDAVPSAENVEVYAEIVWTKFVARKFLETATTLGQEVLEGNGLSEGTIGKVTRQMEEWQELARLGGDIQPQDLRRAGDYGDEVMGYWFGEKGDEAPGMLLPISFPLKLRPGEVTMICGEDGSGKSLMALQIIICLLAQGWKAFVASFEVRVEMTLYVMTRQLLGKGPRLPDTEGYRKQIVDAMAYLNERVWMYDFLGITHWRLLLDVMRYAREKFGIEVFVIDSLMRIGIPEDDYATQSLAAAEFAAFAVQTNSHVILVHHMNKSREASLKAKAQGSKRWTDNTHNIVEMQRNAEKKLKMEEANEELRLVAALRTQPDQQGKERQEKYDERTKKAQETIEKMRTEHDGKFLLGKQRYPGTPQNGSKWLFFDEASLQFRDNRNDTATNYLVMERNKQRKEKRHGSERVREDAARDAGGGGGERVDGEAGDAGEPGAAGGGIGQVDTDPEG